MIGLEVPSAEAFKSLPYVTEQELEFFAPLHTLKNDEYLAAVFVEAYRRKGSVSDLMALELSGTDYEESFVSIAYAATATPGEARRFYWSLSDVSDKNLLYYAFIYLKYGTAIKGILKAIEADPLIPELVPVKWFESFLVANEQLQSEGIVLPISSTMFLAAHWNVDEIIKLVVDDVSLEEAKRMLQAGVDSVEEVTDMIDSLPQEWLDEFFS